VSRSPDVDVVILTWNDPPEMLEAAVASVVASSVVSRLIVVDNGSAPSVEPIDGVDVWRRSRSNLGVAGGRNLGASLGSSDVICFLDSDAALRPETLDRMEDELRREGVGAVGPVFIGQAPEASGGRAPSLWRKTARAMGLTSLYAPTPRNGSAWDVDFVIGACLMVRRADFENVGGFDTTYFYGPEDVDLCLRMRETGRRVRQVGVALCLHPPRRRYRVPLSRQGLRHGWAVARHLVRHRGRPR